MSSMLRLIALSVGFFVASCSERVQLGRDLPAANAGGESANGGGSGGVSLSIAGEGGSSASAGQAAHVCQVTPCQNKVYECGDCRDNDEDRLTDSGDPECTGPCDNTESSYFGGIPGQNNAPCRQDCYFDQNTGAGDDSCYWSHECDPLSVSPAYAPSGDARCAYDPSAAVPGSAATCSELMAFEPAACTDFCLPITPNGCDCFGCCELPADSGQFVWIGGSVQNTGTCDAAHLNDRAACRPCTPVTSCFNACDTCEVCVGRTAPLAGCATPGSERCPAGLSACGQLDEPACEAGEYCVTGCCVLAPR